MPRLDSAFSAANVITIDKAGFARLFRCSKQDSGAIHRRSARPLMLFAANRGAL
jgi:hypothetical protein